MWLKAKTPIKVSSSLTIPEGEIFEAEEHFASEREALELKDIGAAEDAIPPAVVEKKAPTGGAKK